MRVYIDNFIATKNRIGQNMQEVVCLSPPKSCQVVVHRMPPKLNFSSIEVVQAGLCVAIIRVTSHGCQINRGANLICLYYHTVRLFNLASTIGQLAS